MVNNYNVQSVLYVPLFEYAIMSFFVLTSVFFFYFTPNDQNKHTTVFRNIQSLPFPKIIEKHGIFFL